LENQAAGAQSPPSRPLTGTPQKQSIILLDKSATFVAQIGEDGK
jgi:hypothetical protein